MNEIVSCSTTALTVAQVADWIVDLHTVTAAMQKLRKKWHFAIDLAHIEVPPEKLADFSAAINAFIKELDHA